MSWSGGRITDVALDALATCPRLHTVGLAGTAITSDGLRRLFAAAAARSAAAQLRVDVSSCRGLDRAVRQAATLGMAQLRTALGC